MQNKLGLFALLFEAASSIICNSWYFLQVWNIRLDIFIIRRDFLCTVSGVA